MKFTQLLLSLCLISICTEVGNAATVPAGFTDAVVASGLNNPSAMALAPDGRIFVCQQSGALRVIKNFSLPNSLRTSRVFQTHARV